MGSSNSSDTESNYSEHQTPRKFARKSHSSPVSGEPLLERSEEDTGSAVKIPNSDIDPVMDSATVDGRLRTRTSILSQILELHPTRIGLWRLQKGVCVCVCVVCVCVCVCACVCVCVCVCVCCISVNDLTTLSSFIQH